MASETTERFMHTLQQIEKTGDVEPLVAMFAEDAELSNLATPSPLRGQDGARQFWQKYLSVFDRIGSKFTNVVESNGSAVLEWISEGALNSGEPLTYRGVSVIETDNGQVQRFRTYYDSAAFLPQGAKKMNTMIISEQSQKVIVPQLGLVCITSSDKVRYRALTRKRLLQLELSEQTRVLRELYAENLRRLNGAIAFCDSNNIRLYRLTSALFPFADEPVGEAVLTEFTEELKQTGDRAQSLGIRIVVHPDQFVVLSSDKPEVIENSIKILNTHARTLDLLGLPRSPWTVMEIHGGKSDRAERLINVIRNLPSGIRSRLALENDEYAYSANEILEVCRATGVPMVFDAHHHIIHEKVDSYEHPSVAEMLAAARTTWPFPEWQLVHISNGSESFNDPHHSDFITVMPSSYRNAPWIEVEAKLKEQAIEKLRTEWLSN